MAPYRFTPIRNIAVPMDSTESEVVELAERLALHCDATVHLFSAKSYPMWVTSLGGEYVFAPVGPPGELAEDEVTRRTAEVNRRAQGLDSRTEVTVVVGETESSLLAFLEQEAIDLVVVGSTGVDFWTRLLHSSLAGNLSRASSVPVLVVPPGVDTATIARDAFHRVVVATNGESIADLGGRLAASLAMTGATIEFVHVADAGRPDDLTRGDQRPVELGELVERIAPSGCVSRAVIEHGDVAETLVGHARHSGADLLIVGSRAHGHPGDRLLGTTADRVLAEASCCVVAVPARVLEVHAERADRERRVDEAVDESFPASDSPSFTPER